MKRVRKSKLPFKVGDRVKVAPGTSSNIWGGIVDSVDPGDDVISIRSSRDLYTIWVEDELILISRRQARNGL